MQRLSRRTQTLHFRHLVQASADAEHLFRRDAQTDQGRAAHFGRSMHKRGVLQFVPEPPIAAMLKNIVGMRRRTVAIPVKPPKQPRRRRRRSAPRCMNQRRRIPSERTGKKARESGAQHVFPKIDPRRRPPREQTVQHLPQHLGPAPTLIRNHPKEREQTPLVEPRHRQTAKRIQPAPQRIKPHLHAVGAHRDDLPLQKCFRALGKRREQVGDDRLGSGQDRGTLEFSAPTGQAHCARR